MAQVTVNGTALNYTEAGDGEPLVFVHGSASDARTWRAQEDAFADRCRVLTYSRRYHWPNEPIPPGADYSMAEHVADLRALLGALDAAPAHLVGHSYGAFVALLLAQLTPEVVRTLTLAEPPVITLYTSDPPTPLEILKLLVTRPRTAAGIVKLGATGLGPAAAATRRGDHEAAMRLSGAAILGRDVFARVSEARKGQQRANFIPAELLGSGFPMLDADRLRRIRTPTLVVTGTRSPRVFHRLADGLEEILPHTERVDIPGASHIMHEDNPSAYAAAVASFVERYTD